MARCLWDPAKNRRLIAERGVSFEEVATLIESGALVDVFDHPDPKRSHQRIAVIEIGDYAYLVPYVETEAGDFFLKTVIPSRKAARKYLRESGREMTERMTKLDSGALDPEESEILRAYEEGRLRRTSDSSGEAQRLEAAARETLRKDKRINIRLPSHDLVQIKRLAAREGVPYQTLISSILHKYATGELG